MIACVCVCACVYVRVCMHVCLCDSVHGMSCSMSVLVYYASQPEICVQYKTCIEYNTMNMLSRYLERHTKSVILIKGTYYQYSWTSVY